MYDPSWSMTDDDIARIESDRFMREEAEQARKEAEPVRLGQAVSEWAAEHPHEGSGEYPYPDWRWQAERADHEPEIGRLWLPNRSRRAARKASPHDTTPPRATRHSMTTPPTGA